MFLFGTIETDQYSKASKVSDFGIPSVVLYLCSALMTFFYSSCKKDTGPSHFSADSLKTFSSIIEHEYPAFNNKTLDRTYLLANKTITTVLTVDHSSTPTLYDTMHAVYDHYLLINLISQNKTGYSFQYNNQLVNAIVFTDTNQIPFKQFINFYDDNNRLITTRFYEKNPFDENYNYTGQRSFGYDDHGNIELITYYDQFDTQTSQCSFTYDMNKVNKQDAVGNQFELFQFNRPDELLAFYMSPYLLQSSDENAVKHTFNFALNDQLLVTTIKKDGHTIFSYEYIP